MKWSGFAARGVFVTWTAMMCFGLSAPSHAASQLWQTNAEGDDIHVFDVESRQLAQRLVVGPQPHGIAAPDDGRVVSNFIVQALTARDITIYGEGSQTRSFCYISDLVEGLVRLMNREDWHDPVNLGNPEEYTSLELARKILAMTQSQAQLVYQTLPPDDPVKRRPDITRARELLDRIRKDDLREHPTSIP